MPAFKNVSNETRVSTRLPRKDGSTFAATVAPGETVELDVPDDFEGTQFLQRARTPRGPEAFKVDPEPAPAQESEPEPAQEHQPE